MLAQLGWYWEDYQNKSLLINIISNGMEQNFQTSFIPKKPIVEERVTPASFKVSIG